MAGFPFVGLLVSSLLYFDSSQGFLQTDVSCKPRKTLIPLDAPYYDQYPFFADVFRCAGGCTTFNPTFYHCVAKTTNNVSGQVISLSLGTQMTVVVENHTSCDCACAKSATRCTENGAWNEDQCSCLCKYPNGPPSPCPTGLSWIQDECKCVCKKPVEFCSVSKEWSQEYCGCVCTRFAAENCKAENKNLNTATCECEDSARVPGVTGKRSGEGLTSTMLIIAMVAELWVLVVLFDLYLFWRYRKGVCSWLHVKFCVRASPKESNTGEPKMSTTN